MEYIYIIQVMRTAVREDTPPGRRFFIRIEEAERRGDEDQRQERVEAGAQERASDKEFIQDNEKGKPEEHDKVQTSIEGDGDHA